MTETFKASNGCYVDEDGALRGTFGDLLLLPIVIDHTRQFFQELRDHELGRWRSKKDPSWTAVNADEIVYFQNEDGKRSFSVNADETTNHWWSGDLVKIAREYFAAHPQHKPLPTEPGLYCHRGAFDMKEYSRVLGLAKSGVWADVNRSADADMKQVAQEWHNAGQLVRLGIVESEDEK